MITLPKTHITLTSANKISEICHPLFELTEINFFYFVRLFNNNTLGSLITDHKWIQYKLEKEYRLVSPFPEETTKNSFYYLSEYNDDYKQTLEDFGKYFDKGHKINFVEKNTEYIDIFSFATHKNNLQIINYYLNHIDMLKKFILYFKESASFFINLSLKNPIKISQSLLPNLKHQKNNIANKKLLSSIALKRYRTNNKYFKVTITRRELDCLKYLYRGRSTKEIGNLINISQRTVEYYLNNIKNKLGYYRKSELIDFIEQEDLGRYF